jgi:tetratricopeptide (TPR) repeat protein
MADIASTNIAPLCLCGRPGRAYLPLMPIRFLASSFAAATLAAALAGPALPQSRGWVQPPSELPKTFDEKMHNLDFLFGALKAAPDESSAKAIEQRIWAQWIISKSDTTNLLMTRVKTAVDAKDLDLALRLLDAVIELNPTYVEGWNRRATLRYMRKEFGESLADIRRVLTIEPRHFGALTGLGLIMQEFGDEKRALEAFRKALDLYPHLQRVPDMVKSLTDKVDGRDI